MEKATARSEQPTKGEAGVAKNYLTEEELAELNRMTSAFFDLAELRTMQHQPMYMRAKTGQLICRSEEAL